MKPIIWVFFIYLAHQVLCAPPKVDESDKRTYNDEEHQRLKRASRNGQTQSQYLNFGDSQTEGKADAEITRYGSRASVSGSNGMGQAQSQSSGTGCDECYGGENSFSNGGTHGPDPLRSLSGSGLPQSQASSHAPSGFDAHGQLSSVPDNGYTSKGFGPLGPRTPSSKHVQQIGTGSDGIPQNGVLSVTTAPITGTSSQPGSIHQQNRGQPSLGGPTFLNRPISKSKVATNDHTTRPSILTGRKSTSSSLDNSKLVDAPGSAQTSYGSQPPPRQSTQGLATGSNLLDDLTAARVPQSGRGTFDSPLETPSSGSDRSGAVGSHSNSLNVPSSYETISGTIPPTSFDRPKGADSQPSSYDASFKIPLIAGDRSRSGQSFQPEHPVPSLDQVSHQNPGTTSITEPGAPTVAGAIPSQTGNGFSYVGIVPPNNQKTTDSLSGLRNAFRLPTGLCLVRCDTLQQGQYSLTPEQIKDAFIASGLIDQRGGSGSQGSGTSVSSAGTSSQGSALHTPTVFQYPTGSQFPTSSGLPQYQQPNNQISPGAQFPTIGSQSGLQYPSTGGQFPSGSQYPSSGGQFPPGSQYPFGAQYPIQGQQSSQYPSSGGQFPLGPHFPSIGQSGTTGTPGTQYPSSGQQNFQYPSGSQYSTTGGQLGILATSGAQYPSGMQQGTYPSQSLPQYQQPTGSVSYPTQGQPQYPRPSGVHIPSNGFLPQSGIPSHSMPSVGQFSPAGPSPSISQPINQPDQVGSIPSHYSGNLLPAGYNVPDGGTIPQGQIATGMSPQYAPTTGQMGTGPGIPVSTAQTGLGQYPTIGSQIPQGVGPFTQTGSQAGAQAGILPTSASQYLPSGTQALASSGVLPIYPQQMQQGIGTGLPVQGILPAGQYTATGVPGLSSPSSLGSGLYPPTSSGDIYSNIAYPSQGGFAVGQPGQSADSVYPGQTGGAQIGSGISNPNPSSIPSAGNVVYGGGDGSGSSGASQNGDIEGGSESGSSSIDEDGFSQAESSIKNGEVVASAQGTKNGGTAQTQVQGTYSGTGSFSASAQTADKERSAQAQVSGHKDGALSSSQGSGGKSQAQAQVEVNEKTGGTSASGQSSGSKHSSQSEVVANEKGGLADAQSSGPGQTSSQAQIGFRPEGANMNPSGNLFNGGGQASAQSGVHSGQSQSQIQGSFKYGIAYHGAAQAASGTKDQVNSYREKSKKLFQSIGQFSRSNRDAVTQAPVSDIANINEIGLFPKSSAVAPDSAQDESVPEDADYERDEGEDEYDESPEEKNLNKTKTSRVEIELPQPIESSTTVKSNDMDKITIPTEELNTNNTKLVRLPAVRSEIVPNGFKGKIDGKRHKSPKNHIEFDKKIDVKPDSYVTVTKSVSGSLDNSKTSSEDDKKFESTYYTKSSTCGYFTFSCNIVYGSNGRSKICRPKTPANGKC